MRADKGLYHRLVARGAMQTLLPAGAAQSATSAAPEDTRAYFRGECLRRYADDIAATIMAAIDMPHRVLWPEVAIFANNPWKEN